MQDINAYYFTVPIDVINDKDKSLPIKILKTSIKSYNTIDSTFLAFLDGSPLDLSFPNNP